MAEAQLERGQVTFQTEGRLLQELGERLVAKSEVALVELVKNSFDADASKCEVSLDKKNTLVISDDGLGMSFSQFSQRWMRIASSHKVHERTSQIYQRRLTGQKGIGRFAVRFLGRALKLDSVAWDADRKLKTRLTADFDWKSLDEQDDLRKATIPYRLLRTDPSAPTGTTLYVRELREDTEFVQSSDFRTSVLKIVSPLVALDRGRFGKRIGSDKKDPGFTVRLPGDIGSGEELDIAETVLAHAWARLSINMTGDSISYAVKFHEGESTERLKTRVRSSIRNGLVADIRFFPRRAGVFRNSEVNGNEAWAWVRENTGVAVVDHGFRIRPYGYPDDDWLRLDRDSAHNERDWFSSISQREFPIPAAVRSRKENPMLNLPSTFQLVGAVFVESAIGASGGDDDLIPAMDREGFLYNDAFEQLVDVVRGGIEFLTHQDRIWLQRESEKRAKEAARNTRADLRAAVEYIEQSPTLTRADKVRLVEDYTGLAKKLNEVEEYDREARRKLETMSALGVVAGFMTHETARIVSALGEALKELRRLSRKHPTLRQNVLDIEQSHEALQGHLEYARTFIDATQKGQSVSFKAAPQVQRVIEKFGSFAQSRGIVVESDIEPSTEAPRMPIAVYSGVLLNLYTNALKAILASESPQKPPRIRFRANNEGRWHILEVLDTGVGIPPNLRKRIWDPLFTTTSRLNNPLGSGMGLGLSLVQQLVEQIGGRITIVDAPEGFSTCFRVQLPRT